MNDCIQGMGHFSTFRVSGRSTFKFEVSELCLAEFGYQRSPALAYPLCKMNMMLVRTVLDRLKDGLDETTYEKVLEILASEETSLPVLSRSEPRVDPH